MAECAHTTERAGPDAALWHRRVGYQEPAAVRKSQRREEEEGLESKDQWAKNRLTKRRWGHDSSAYRFTDSK
jgi:hypothetical protein